MPAPLPAPNFDPGAVYPEVAQVRLALRDHDWPALSALFAALDPSARSYLVGFAAGWGGIETFLRMQLDRRPDDPLAGTLLGAYLVQAGWRIRTRASADRVSADRFARFHDHLRRAEQVLIDATARYPDDTAAWTQRITVARGLALGQNEARRRYDRLARHQPHHLPAQSSLLQQLCPKWGGTWERVHAFAGECAETAPPGSHNAVLVVEAHLEEAMEAADPRGMRDHLSGPQVVEEVHAAARRSVWHPDFRHTLGWVAVRSTFAMAFGLMGEHGSARDQFDVLGPYAEKAMFGYLGDWRDGFTRARSEAYAKGDRR